MNARQAAEYRDELARAVLSERNARKVARPADRRPTRPPITPPPAAGALLTTREQQALEDLAAGLTWVEAGLKHGLSKQTIKLHRQSLYRKLEVCGGAHAVAVAFRLGLLT